MVLFSERDMKNSNYLIEILKYNFYFEFYSVIFKMLKKICFSLIFLPVNNGERGGGVERR